MIALELRLPYFSYSSCRQIRRKVIDYKYSAAVSCSPSTETTGKRLGSRKQTFFTFKKFTAEKFIMSLWRTLLWQSYSSNMHHIIPENHLSSPKRLQFIWWPPNQLLNWDSLITSSRWVTFCFLCIFRSIPRSIYQLIIRFKRQQMQATLGR